jgi:hypothetical protein
VKKDWCDGRIVRRINVGTHESLDIGYLRLTKNWAVPGWPAPDHCLLGYHPSVVQRVSHGKLAWYMAVLRMGNLHNKLTAYFCRTTSALSSPGHLAVVLD